MYPQEIIDMVVEHTKDLEIAKFVGSDFMFRKMWKANVLDVLTEYINSFEPEKYYRVTSESGKKEINEEYLRLKEEMRTELFGMEGTGEERVQKYECNYSYKLDAILRKNFNDILSSWVVPTGTDIEEYFDLYKKYFRRSVEIESLKNILFCFRFESRLYLHEDNNVDLPIYRAAGYADINIYTPLSGRFEFAELS